MIIPKIKLVYKFGRKSLEKEIYDIFIIFIDTGINLIPFYDIWPIFIKKDLTGHWTMTKLLIISLKIKG